MNFQQITERAVKKISASPKQVIEKARNGSIADLKDLANFWHQVPHLNLVSLGLLDLFFCHLDADKAFDTPSEANERKPESERAFYALLGLAKSADYFLPGALYHNDPAVLKAWPGIFKWSAFFFKTRVISVPPRPVEGRRAAMDVIAMTWYSLTRADNLRETMASTKGSIEIATHIWLLDSEVPFSGPQLVNIPSAAAALDAILIDASTLDRVVTAGGGNPEPLIKIAMSRTRTALGRTHIVPQEATIYLDLLGHLSRAPNHPLRLGLLNAGAIALCTRAAVTLVRALNARGDPAFLDGVIAGLSYLANCLQSTEGFTWVIQSLNADLLVALVETSPYFSQMDEDDYDMITLSLKETLPTYLVYRSVIQAVDQGMQRLQPEHFKKIGKSKAKDLWNNFRSLAEERLFVVLHAAAVKGKAATCDNVQCQKIDAKNTFRKCSGCSTTLYCSKECQTVAWKEGGHKQMCKMKQRERLEGKSQAITKSDSAFFHHLATRDARHHLPLLRRLGRSSYPALRWCDLLIRIDYTVVPPDYSVVPLAEAEAERDRTGMQMNGFSNAEARSDALIERARQNPERFGLVQSKIVSGHGMQLVLSAVTGNFWEENGDFKLGTGELYSEEEDEHFTVDTDIDDVDIMLARTTINQFLAHHGEKPGF
ncbi:hypothetical protein R3P38DRAFT_2628704 [Favolaschia claudopus]|uniref:MYND-type domain-containing protein n=1 Tax=Favolaschia claudopus TaxID=2862362 RepID=A0AAW0B9Q4_9AGAR